MQIKKATRDRVCFIQRLLSADPNIQLYRKHIDVSVMKKRGARVEYPAFHLKSDWVEKDEDVVMKDQLGRAQRDLLARRRAENNGDDILAVPTKKRNAYRLEAKDLVVTLDEIFEHKSIFETVAAEMDGRRSSLSKSERHSGRSAREKS